MTSKKELQVAYGLAIIFLVVGILSYAAFPAKAPDQPVRLMFEGVAGNVLFDHKTHTVDSGYGIACQDCHHNLEAGETNPESCGACHEIESGDEDVPKRSDAFHLQCIGCHKEGDAGPQECSGCHVM
ncbi:MAG: cytochrome c3 family protein [Desulfobacterales bacterium]|nr:cytochrome c3 family protein [Desulfobacterales bacterium]